jgi:hypothetical protein
MKKSDQLDIPTALPPGKEPPVTVDEHVNPLNAELNPIYHLLAVLGGATIVDVSRLRVKCALQPV